jgi:hypothetical protein
MRQTGVGPRQFVDVVFAAARERCYSTVAPRRALSLAERCRRGLFFYGMALTFTIVSPMFPPYGHAVDLADPSSQLSVLTVFLVAAAMCWCMEAAAFRFILRGRASSGEGRVVSSLAFVVSAIAIDALSTSLSPGPFLSSSSFGVVAIFAEMFARPLAIEQAMSPAGSPARIGSPS